MLTCGRCRRGAAGIIGWLVHSGAHLVDASGQIGLDNLLSSLWAGTDGQRKHIPTGVRLGNVEVGAVQITEDA